MSRKTSLAALTSSIIFLAQSVQGDIQPVTSTIKIGKHFYKDSGKHQPLTDGILMNHFALITVNKERTISFHKPSNMNDRNLEFNIPEGNECVWTSGSIGGSAPGLPFIFMSNRIESNYFSLDYFFAWKAHLKIENIKHKSGEINFAILIPKPSNRADSFYFVPSTIDSGSATYTVTPGAYLLLISHHKMISNKSRFTVVDQKSIIVTAADAASLDEVFINKSFNDLAGTSFTTKEIVDSCPWLVSCGLKDSELIELDINQERVTEFEKCK